MIVASGPVDQAQVQARLDLEGDIADGGGKGEGALAIHDGLVVVADHPAILGQMGVDPAQPSLIVKPLGEGFGGAQVVEHRPGFAERHE